MGKSSSPEMVVNKYFLSQHFGVCAEADAILALTIKEKPAWSGRVETQSEIVVDRGNLFGGAEKEGGVEGVVHYLPGASDQLLSNLLAQKLGRSSGADCPGFRGLASLFFTGPLGTTNANYAGWNKRVKGKRGFYWTANNPYLPGVWVTLERAPKGLNPDYALVPRIGATTPTGSVEVTWWAISYDDPSSDDTSKVGIECYNSIGDPIGPISWSPSASDHVWTQHSHTFDVPTGTAYGRLYVEMFRRTGANNDAYVDDISATFNGSPLTLTNPGGETGDMTGWTLALGTATVINNPGGPHSGTYYFYGGPPGVGDVSNRFGRFWQEIDIEVAGGTPVDANPAHIIYECLTNTDWGMGSPDTAIDVANFEAVGLALYGESFGLSMIWTRQSSIQDFIQEVLDHIQAVLFVDPATGLLTLKLIRGDYNVDTLEEINPDNAELSNFGRKLWGEIINEVVVTWTQPENEQDETVVVQDLASIVTQGGIISDGRNYYGVRYSALAHRLAQRDLRSAGAPLASCEAEVDRTLWTVRPASVYRIVWPEYGLDGVIMRVTDVNYGKPGDPSIKLTLVEDIFGLDVGTYTDPPDTIWEDPASDPEPLEDVLIFTMPYFMAANTSVAAFIDSPEYPEVIAGVLGSTENADTFNYELWDEVALPDSSLEWQSLATANVIGRAELITPWVAEAETEFDVATDLTEIFGQTSPTQGGFVIIGEGTEAESEIAMVTADGATITVSRGVLDTVPKAWPAATPVWFVDQETLFEDPVLRAAGEVVSYRMLTRTSQGLLDLADAPDESYTLTERPWLPSRPANILIDAVAFNTIDAPVDMTGEPDVTVTWSNRNRLTEDSVVLNWGDGDVTPETGQTTTITIYAADETTVLDTITGLSSTSHDIPLSSFGGASLALVRLTSERTDADGTFASLQGHGIWVQVGDITFDETGITWDVDTITWDTD